jgi:mRNA-degrading endonuclease toxin of MazEF toxin-antitoxin module
VSGRARPAGATRVGLRWAIVLVDLEPVQGHEQGGTRRVLVVSYEPFHRSGLMTVCPISAARQTSHYPGDVPIAAGEAGQTKAGVIVCAQPRTVSTARVRGRVLGVVRDTPTRTAVRKSLAHHLGLDIPARLHGALAE